VSRRGIRWGDAPSLSRLEDRRGWLGGTQPFMAGEDVDDGAWRDEQDTGLFWGREADR
jgi:hypothetical protein